MCCDTPPSFGEDIPRLIFLFCALGGDGGGEGLGGRKYILLGSSLEWNVSSSVVVYDVFRLLKALTFIGGDDIEDGTDRSGDSGLYPSLLSSYVGVTTAMVARMLNGLGGRSRSFRLGGTIGSSRPNPYGIVGSLESSSMVNICGWGDAIDETEGIRAVCCSKSSVELRIFGVLCLRGLGSVELCSTQNTSESSEASEIFAIVVLVKNIS